MKREEKILSMLDMLATQMQEVSGEIREFKKETNGQFDELRKETNGQFDELRKETSEIRKETNEIRANMVTKAEFNKSIADSQEDIKAMLTIITKKVNDQSVFLETKFDLLNNRLLNQETHMRVLEKKKVL